MLQQCTFSCLGVLPWATHVCSPQPFCHQLSGCSRSLKSCRPLYSQRQACRQHAALQEESLETSRLLESQIGEGQTLAGLQSFTAWLIESGVQGLHGDSRNVELYQYGEDGRGLRTIKVLCQYFHSFHSADIIRFTAFAVFGQLNCDTEHARHQGQEWNKPFPRQRRDAQVRQ